MPTVNRKEIEFSIEGPEANRLILKPIFFEDIMQYFDVMPQVTNEKKMAYSTVMEDVLQNAISCGLRPKGTIDLYERCITTTPVGAFVNQCFDDVLNTAYSELLKTGKDITDMTGTIFGELLVTRVVEAVKKHIEKLAFFGDKTSADENLNLVDGIWKYIFDLVSKNAIPWIDTNSGTPLTAGDAVDYFDAIYDAQRPVLEALAPSEKVMYVSSNLYKQYKKDLREGGFGSTAYANDTQKGIPALNYEGIEIKPMWDWPRYAELYLNSPNANLIILTTRDNLVYATDVENNATNLEVWYDRDSEQNKVRTRFRFGVNWKIEEFFVVGY